jgi:hypothetical protein
VITWTTPSATGSSPAYLNATQMASSRCCRSAESALAKTRSPQADEGTRTLDLLHGKHRNEVRFEPVQAIEVR